VTDEHAFLAQILSQPADDVARTVYADWLDEAGGARRAARAEFIRVQVELSRTPEFLWRRGTLLAPTGAGGFEPYDSARGHEPYPTMVAAYDAPDPRHGRLAHRQWLLLKKWGRAWMPRVGRRLAAMGGTHGVLGEVVTAGAMGLHASYTFRRGFVEEAELGVGSELLAPDRTFQRTEPFFRELLQSQPVNRIRFQIRNFTPQVYVHVEPQDLEVYAVAFDAPGEPGELIMDESFRDRTQLARLGARLICQHLAEEEFERITDPDDGDGLDDVPPDDGDQGYGHTYW
jgi:uncharacterized protein (TIGR02996 family)